jgi:hypothetical protein
VAQEALTQPKEPLELISSPSQLLFLNKKYNTPCAICENTSTSRNMPDGMQSRRKQWRFLQYYVGIKPGERITPFW